MKPTREPRLDRLDGELMPEVVCAYDFLPDYFAGLRNDVPHVDLWNHRIISMDALDRKVNGGEPKEYADKLMDERMHKHAFDEALREGCLQNGEQGVSFRPLVEWALSRGYVPRAGLYCALYAKEPNWRDVAVNSVVWRLRHAAHYLLSREPLKDDNLQEYILTYCGPIDQEILIGMLERAIEVKELPAWQDLDEWKTDEWLVKPESVCRWFREKGLTLPEPLHRLADGLFPLINKRAAAARKERELNQQQKECVEFAFKCAQEWPEMARSPRGGKITASSLTTLLEQKAPLKWKDTSEPPYCHDRLTRLISKHVIPEIRKDKRSVRTKNVQRPEK